MYVATARSLAAFRTYMIWNWYQKASSGDWPQTQCLLHAVPPCQKEEDKDCTTVLCRRADNAAVPVKHQMQKPFLDLYLGSDLATMRKEFSQTIWAPMPILQLPRNIWGAVRSRTKLFRFHMHILQFQVDRHGTKSTMSSLSARCPTAGWQTTSFVGAAADLQKFISSVYKCMAHLRHRQACSRLAAHSAWLWYDSLC